MGCTAKEMKYNSRHKKKIHIHLAEKRFFFTYTLNVWTGYTYIHQLLLLLLLLLVRFSFINGAWKKKWRSSSFTICTHHYMHTTTALQTQTHAWAPFSSSPKPIYTTNSVILQRKLKSLERFFSFFCIFGHAAGGEACDEPPKKKIIKVCCNDIKQNKKTTREFA